MAAITCNGHWERRGFGCQLRWAGMALGRKDGSSSQSRWAGNQSEARRRQLLTVLTHNRHLVEAPGQARLGSRRTPYTVGDHTKIMK